MKVTIFARRWYLNRDLNIRERAVLLEEQQGIVAGVGEDGRGREREA